MMRILAVRTTFFMAIAATFAMGLSREVHADVYTSLALGDSLAFGVGADRWRIRATVVGCHWPPRFDVKPSAVKL